MKTPTLYDEIKAAGIIHASHESDLYLPDTPQVRAILAKHPEVGPGVTFCYQGNGPELGKRWLDVPFAYLPWWWRRKNPHNAELTDAGPVTPGIG